MHGRLVEWSKFSNKDHPAFSYKLSICRLENCLKKSSNKSFIWLFPSQVFAVNDNGKGQAGVKIFTLRNGW